MFVHITENTCTFSVSCLCSLILLTTQRKLGSATEYTKYPLLFYSKLLHIILNRNFDWLRTSSYILLNTYNNMIVIIRQRIPLVVFISFGVSSSEAGIVAVNKEKL